MLQTFFHPPPGWVDLFEIITRMVRIYRSAIDIACIAIAMFLNVLLKPVMARPAQRLQWTVPKQIGISIMGLDMVRYCRSRHPMIGQAHDAEGLLLQLLPASRVPASVVVESGMAAVPAHRI